MGKIGHDKDLGKLIASEDYTQYRLLSIEEAEFILCDVYSYIHDDFLTLEEKSIRIRDVINFFEFESEPIVVKELKIVQEAIYLRILLDDLHKNNSY
jgi:hypothetical protein